MERNKFCCGGQNAEMIETLFPVTKIRFGKPVKVFTAAYKCHKCGELTVRGESQQASWNTYVEYINESTLKELIKDKELYNVAKTSVAEVRSDV